MKIMTQKQGFIKRAFTHNLREKILSALCAVLVMFVAICFKPVSKVYSVKVNTKISPDQLLVSENIDKIEVKVSGSFFELRKIKSEDLVINFDLSSENAGEINRTLDESFLSSSFSALDIKSILPQTLTFITEEKKTEPVETLPETSPETSSEQKPAETSPEQKPAETLPETSLEQKVPAAEEKND